ncbi:DUF5049 domain-containing protein [uncultured Alistipes sp.]|uniref:DUF5049 domain-containing protein n=1 Tax=uncultured Alistipes sp. TaxID=538949 RepID=UPI00321FE133
MQDFTYGGVLINRHKFSGGKGMLTEKIKEQIFAVRDSGAANMCNMAAVQRAAFDRGFYELVLFIEENRESYWDFILTGRE